MRSRMLLAALATLVCFASAHAQSEWPAGKVIKIVVPFPPGGTYDSVARGELKPPGSAPQTHRKNHKKPGAGPNQRDALSEAELQPAARPGRRDADREPAECAGDQPGRPGKDAG